MDSNIPDSAAEKTYVARVIWANWPFLRYCKMQRYFFDTRDDDSIIIDDIGVCLAGPAEAKELATKALAELALDVLPRSVRRCLGVDVRDGDSKAVLTARMTFEAEILD